MEDAQESNNLQKVLVGLKVFGMVFDEIAQNVNSYVEKHKDEIGIFSEYLENFDEIHSVIWREAAEYGWFPSQVICSDFENYVLEGKEQLDDYMVSETRPYVGDLHRDLIYRYPNRKGILDAAFELHNQGNYIAAIPLFLSQTDGICAQEIGCYLFTEHGKREEKIRELIDSSPESSVVLSPMLHKTQFGASISKGSQALKAKAPNRNGILHGSRKHLDYGTEVNSLKSISLLSYVAEALCESK